MGFDDEYYTSSTQEEINQFYQKYCTISNDDIPDVDEVRIYDDKPVETKHINSENDNATMMVQENDLSEFDDLTTDPDDILADVSKNTNIKAEASNMNDDIDAEKLIAGLDI